MFPLGNFVATEFADDEMTAVSRCKKDLQTFAVCFLLGTTDEGFQLH